MSEVVRNYTGQAGSMRTRPRRFRRRGWLLRTLVPLVAFATVLFWWTTRDSYRFAACIPADQRLTVILDDPLPARSRVVESQVWDALPDEWTSIKQPALTSDDIGIPQWVMNNLFYKRAIVTGNELGEASDVVLLTRMTRIGTLLERFHGIMGGVEDDYAGGLYLRTVPGHGIHYAVRGRLLLLSQSRDALIRSLTLTESDQLPQTQFDELARSGGEDIRGTVALSPEHALGQYFETIAFALRVDSDAAHAKCRAIIRPEAVKRFAALTQGVSPTSLRVPPDGLISVSGNFGKPVEEIWSALGEITGVPWLGAAQWQAWRAGNPENPLGVGPFLTGLVGDKGPGIQLAMTSIDTNEFVPLPILVAVLDGDVAGVKAQLESIPAPPADVQPWDPFPRFDAENGMAYIPLMGGPSLEPAVAAHQDTVLISSSRAAAEAYLAKGAPRQELPQPGNLYVRIQPGPLVEAVIDAGRLLVEIDCLHGYSPETYEVAAASWSNAAQKIDSITGIAAVQGNTIDLEFRIACPGAAPEISPDMKQD